MRNHIADLVDMFVSCRDMRTATKYLSPNKIIRLTRIAYGKKPNPKNAKSESFVLTIGKPNIREREFIKLCQQAREPFPVKKILYKMFPKKKSSR